MTQTAANDYEPTVVEYGSEAEACEALNLLANQDADHVLRLFRGQPSRHTRFFPAAASHGLQKHSLELESLVPTDTRGMDKEASDLDDQGLNWVAIKKQLDPKYGDAVARVRYLLAQYLIQEHSAWKNPVVVQWWNKLQCLLSRNRNAKLLSIGQHYGFRTHYLDATHNWKVALWIATHRFKDGAYRCNEKAVVYQLDLSGLCEAEKAAHSETPVDQFYHVPIHDTPFELAPRASHQSGWSLVGTASPIWLAAMVASGSLVAHVFPCGPQASDENALTLTDMCPQPDEMADRFGNIRNDPSKASAAFDWIDHQDSTLKPSIGFCNDLFA